MLPELAKLLDCSLDELFGQSNLMILSALYGDGFHAVEVTKRLNRLVESDRLDIVVSDAILGAAVNHGRVCYLVVIYQALNGVGHIACRDGENLVLTAESAGSELPDKGLAILCGCYGTRRHHYDVMPKIRHYSVFHWDTYRADHEIFPSDPANDETEYLTLVYANGDGVHMATCAEGESLVYCDDGRRLIRREKGSEVFLPNVAELPPFGGGMDCSWAAALTVALQSMGINTSYDEVMGISGACYRLAFCSPGWDYSSVDALVAYDYATPGFAAFGYTPQQYCRIEKPERASHRERIMGEIRSRMPVLGINLRVAPEWGVICGYGKDGEDLFCRTKYDRQTIDNDPVFMKGRPPFNKKGLNRYEYLYVDNWPFLLCYFTGQKKRPSDEENLLASLRVFMDSMAQTQSGGYFMGLKAYDVWGGDLRHESFYETCGGEMLARRLSVNQFCSLSLYDARKSAFHYLTNACGLLRDERNKSLEKLAALFGDISEKAQRIHSMLDTGEVLSAERVQQFWTKALRHEQAVLLMEMSQWEQAAMPLAQEIVGG